MVFRETTNVLDTTGVLGCNDEPIGRFISASAVFRLLWTIGLFFTAGQWLGRVSSWTCRRPVALQTSVDPPFPEGRPGAGGLRRLARVSSCDTTRSPTVIALSEAGTSRSRAARPSSGFVKGIAFGTSPRLFPPSTRSTACSSFSSIGCFQGIRPQSCSQPFAVARRTSIFRVRHRIARARGPSKS